MSMLVSVVLPPHGGPRVGSGLWSNPFPRLQRKGGCQQGGAGDPGVLQGQGEAGGVSRRVSAGLGGSWGGGRRRKGFLWLCAIISSCHLSPNPRDVSVELPFVLMHPKPHDHITLPRPQSGEPATHPSPQREGLKQGQRRGKLVLLAPTYPPTLLPSAAPETDAPVDTNLIEFDTK